MYFCEFVKRNTINANIVICIKVNKIILIKSLFIKFISNNQRAKFIVKTYFKIEKILDKIELIERIKIKIKNKNIVIVDFQRVSINI